ncbi:keratin, type I cytoskeletal 19-like [Pelodytes ibericus]
MSINVDCSRFGSINKHKYAGVYYPKPYKCASSPQCRGFHTVQYNITHNPQAGIHRGLGLSSSEHGLGTVVESIALRYSHGSNSSRYGSDQENFSLLSINGKEAMQDLNDRLASYLIKVNLLAGVNSKLEMSIQELYARNGPNTTVDFTQFSKVIREIQSQILSANINNAKITQQINSACMAADDFRKKHKEQSITRASTEAELCTVKETLDGIKKESHDLTVEIEWVQEELSQLKRENEEVVNALSAQLGTRVHVMMDAAQSTALDQSMSKIRKEYESLMETNMKGAEEMFLSMNLELDNTLSSGAGQLQVFQKQCIDLRHCVHTLEIELETHLHENSALESNLQETYGMNNSQLNQLQNVIHNIESNLGQMQFYLMDVNQEYKILTDQKTYLEMEIEGYKKLMNGYDICAPIDVPHPCEGNDEISIHQIGHCDFFVFTSHDIAPHPSFQKWNIVRVKFNDLEEMVIF